MPRSLYQRLFLPACGLALITVAQQCHAHFLWLKTISHDDTPHAFLFFGENTADEAYKLPKSLAKTRLWRRSADGKRTELATENLETDERIGLIARLADKQACVLETTQQYGIYGSSLLVYYAKHVHAGSIESLNAAGRSKELKLDIIPRREADELALTVLWNGEPLAGANVSVAVGDAEAVEKKTDERGRLTLKPEAAGMIAALANHMDKEQSGEVDGKTYKGALHYASLTFEWSKDGGDDENPSSGAKPQAAIPPLPEPVSSFGAAVAGGWLYVYGGHIGEEHEHSAANLSQHFRRLQLQGGTEWEDLPMQTPLQGLALVTHGGKVYRIGGLHARNSTTKNKEDLHSTAEFAEFDPETGDWTALAPLPAPRSSHNAVVIGDRLYVVGGWNLRGKSPGDWQIDALVYDFAEPQDGWQQLPAPFKRRALAAGKWQDKLVAIGGMNAKGKVSQRVDVFDSETGDWSRGPELPGAGLAGFGGAACELDGRLYASGLRGIVYRLDDTGSAWDEAARLDNPRFFHQLLPAGDGRLLAIGGASRKGHLADVEAVDVRPEPATAAVGDRRRK